MYYISENLKGHTWPNSRWSHVVGMTSRLVSVIHSICLLIFYFLDGVGHSSVSIVTKLRAGQSGVRLPAWGKRFFFFKKFRLSLGSTKPPVQWVPGFFPGA